MLVRERFTYVRQMIIKVTMTSAQVATEQSGMSGENGSDIQASHATQNETDAGEPLVKVSHHIFWFSAELM